METNSHQLFSKIHQTHRKYLTLVAKIKFTKKTKTGMTTADYEF